MNSIPPTLWPMPAFTFQAFGALDDQLLDNWRKMMGLNSDFAKSWIDETQFDWAACFMPQDPEEFYARQWTSQMPLMSIPLHYATAMLELGAASQRAWVDAWGRLLGVPILLPAMPVMPDIAAVATASGDVVDVPAVTVRETPQPRKNKAH
ncbi:Phasin protein [Cupriavidus sp. YR651]|uniref:polyhydroxyalkanoate granule-associated phasin n=1 Tax=Cupriavidus sp. YR651 TaxID=1855315 RepID=UPI000890C4B7|nr:polyhydroxyalkanoate granule-associated phasin [Cupriavidus sp. YR651]SDC62962.1 Phasin protein [Cupriavidus sp. YR651]